MHSSKLPSVRVKLIAFLPAVAMASAMGLLLVTPAFANTYAVANTNDSGAGSFRQAVADANSHAGADTINFNIVGCGGVCTIQLASTIHSGLTACPSRRHAAAIQVFPLDPPRRSSPSPRSGVSSG